MSVRVPAAEAEIARARMLALVPAGFEEVDEGDALELAAYTDEAGAERFAAAFGTAASTAVEAG